MAQCKEPIPVLPFCAVTYQDENLLRMTENFLVDILSPILTRSQSFHFSRFTPYYKKEMGENLYKIFYFFSQTLLPENYHLIKLKTNEFEQQHLFSGEKRRLNLDPGYITEAKLVLLSAKDYSHRIYINDGIYAEVQLVYHGNSFSPQPWSYPDYSDAQNIAFINQGRTWLRKKLGK